MCRNSFVAALGRFTGSYEWGGEGRPPCSRVWLAHALIAQHVYPFPTPGALLEALRARSMLRRLCGWESAGDIPSEPTFSRAFAAFAQAPSPAGGKRAKSVGRRTNRAFSPLQQPAVILATHVLKAPP